MLLMLEILLFYSVVIHRDLHSFPTRRSSDLNQLRVSSMTSSEPSSCILKSLTLVAIRGSQTTGPPGVCSRSEEHTSELQSRLHLVCRLLLEKKNQSETPVALLLHHNGSVCRV